MQNFKKLSVIAIMSIVLISAIGVQAQSRPAGGGGGDILVFDIID